MKVLHAAVFGYDLVNVVYRTGEGGYEADYLAFALPGGIVVSKDSLESWASANRSSIRYFYV